MSAKQQVKYVLSEQSIFNIQKINTYAKSIADFLNQLGDDKKNQVIQIREYFSLKDIDLKKSYFPKLSVRDNRVYINVDGDEYAMGQADGFLYLQGKKIKNQLIKISLDRNIKEILSECENAI